MIDGLSLFCVVEFYQQEMRHMHSFQSHLKPLEMVDQENVGK